VENQLFSRGQVEWALWKFSTIDLPSGEEPVSAFRARIRHLLRLDRARTLQGYPWDPPEVAYALSSKDPEGTGVDLPFTALDTFCLAIALDLLRAGFKQAETLLFMLYLRPRLEQALAKILDTPPTFRSHLAGDTNDRQERPADDRRVFLVFQGIESPHIYSGYGDVIFGRSQTAIPESPVVCNGINELRDHLDKMDHLFRRAVVLEIAHMATKIVELLKQAPLKRRGRPAQKT
jgi:hypothetical protein